MVGGNFIDPIQRGGVRPDATKFFRRTNHYNSPLTNEEVKPQVESQQFKSLDGRKWSSQDAVFAANKEYYKKMAEQAKNNMNN